MATVYVDNQPYEMDPRQNLLQACLSAGLDIPYFCWHPALGSVGACRQCAVKLFKDDNDTRGKIVMSCMTGVADGMRISIDDAEAREFRARVIEWLMVNHPHDCPVCDEGGECHLQDMTVMTGHTHRRFHFRKRTHVNQNLGPFVNHEMNRCIACYRCVRFYQDFAGGTDLDVFAAHNHVYFGRREDGTLESEFSGNLVEICPTGVFTDKTLKKHYTRKWDLQSAPSVCVHCGLGCNTFPAERYGGLRRVHSRYHSEVNRYFLCDRGRYGYEFVNNDRRIRAPLWREPRPGPRHEGEARAETAACPVSMESALRHAAAFLGNGSKVIGIGSPRASLEANFALRSLVGPERFFLGLSDIDYRLSSVMLDILRAGPAPAASLREIGMAGALTDAGPADAGPADAALTDAALILGEDVTNTAPLVALALRQSVRRRPMRETAALDIPEWNDGAVRVATQNRKGPLFVATPFAGKLDDVATQTYRAAPDDLTRLGFAVAHVLDRTAPAPPNLSAEIAQMAQTIAQALRDAEAPLVVSGPSCGSESVLRAAANVAWALRKAGRPARLCLTAPECNTMGLALIGGRPLDEVFDLVASGKAETVVILENDLYRRADAEKVDAFFAASKHVIALDHLMNGTTPKADIVLPAGTFAESDGTLVNNEGRAQRFYQVFVPRGDIQESWRWLRDMMVAADRVGVRKWRGLDDIVADLAEALPIFRDIGKIAPTAAFRLAGQKIARQPHRYSGRTAMTADISVHEPRSPEDRDSALAFSMEGYAGVPPAALVPRFWAPGWNSVQSVTRFQEEVNGPLRGGESARRLLEPQRSREPQQLAGPATEAPTSFFADIPAAFAPREGQCLIVPLHHIFGSEELSVLTPGIAERAPRPYLAMNARDAERRGLKDGEEADLHLANRILRLPVKIRTEAPDGVAGVPVGLPSLEFIPLPQWGTLRKV